VQSLAALPDSDIQAIAAYFAAMNRTMSAQPEALAAEVRERARANTRAANEHGRRLYYATCASCHDDGDSTPLATRSELMLNSALWYPWPNNFVLTVLNGVGGAGDAPGPILAIGDYLRQSRLNRPTWPTERYQVDRLRRDTFPPQEPKPKDKFK
jgi:mono/diheme cytochrome c family protein